MKHVASQVERVKKSVSNIKNHLKEKIAAVHHHATQLKNKLFRHETKHRERDNNQERDRKHQRLKEEQNEQQQEAQSRHGWWHGRGKGKRPIKQKKGKREGKATKSSVPGVTKAMIDKYTHCPKVMAKKGWTKEIADIKAKYYYTHQKVTLRNADADAEGVVTVLMIASAWCVSVLCCVQCSRSPLPCCLVKRMPLHSMSLSVLCSNCPFVHTVRSSKWIVQGCSTNPPR